MWSSLYDGVRYLSLHSQLLIESFIIAGLNKLFWAKFPVSYLEISGKPEGFVDVSM